jgi:hypothetical protein
MGKCESAKASIGIRILLSDLILQINETNFNVVKGMLYDGIIEDSNEYFNDEYQNILGMTYKEVYDNHLTFKDFLTSLFTEKRGCLFKQYLLVPIKNILTTNRWGYERSGVNCASRPLDFDLSVDLEKYAEIKNFTTIFLVKQSSD